MTLEAKCGTCGETFIPDVVRDIAPVSSIREWGKGPGWLHQVREDGAYCAGVGHEVGRWG